MARHSEALAFLMGRHRRIGADSLVQSLPPPAVDCVLDFLLLPEPFEWTIFLFRGRQLTHHEFMLFDCMTDVWSLSAPMPSVCYHPEVVSMRGSLYTFYKHPDVAHRWHVARYTPATDSWRTVATLPTERILHKVGQCSGCIYILGGASNERHVGVVEKYDPATDSCRGAAPMPTARYAFEVVAMRGFLYTVGGRTPCGRSTRRYPAGHIVEKYDPLTNAWSRASPIPAYRMDFSAAVIADMLYVVGGDDRNGRLLNAVHRYDPSTDMWTSLAPQPTPRYRAHVVHVGNAMYVLGGFDDLNRDDIQSVDKYNTSSDTWESVAALPAARNDAPAAAIGNCLYLFGGTTYAGDSGSLSQLDDAYKYDPLKDSWIEIASMPRSVCGGQSAYVL